MESQIMITPSRHPFIKESLYTHLNFCASSGQTFSIDEKNVSLRPKTVVIMFGILMMQNT